MGLNSVIQTYQILTNDDEVIPSLSSLAVQASYASFFLFLEMKCQINKKQTYEFIPE